MKQTSNPHVFIAGDVNDDRPLLHEVSDEGRIAGDNAGRFPDVCAGVRRPLAVVFTDPQMALVGSTYRDLSRQGTITGSASFDHQGRSRVMRENRGLKQRVTIVVIFSADAESPAHAGERPPNTTASCLWPT